MLPRHSCRVQATAHRNKHQPLNRFRAIRRGRQLFQRQFTVVQGFGPRLGEGVGSIEGTPAIGQV
jgi:hypothetical protein